jgi:hypothetical protein
MRMIVGPSAKEKKNWHVIKDRYAAFAAARA